MSYHRAVTAFRDAAFKCLTCPDAPLREHGRRLVCDTCGGMQIDAADLQETIGGAGTGEVSTFDAGERAGACPRCTTPLRGLRLQIGTLLVTDAYPGCAQHGVWLTGAQLPALLEWIEKRRDTVLGPRSSAEGGLGKRRPSRSAQRETVTPVQLAEGARPLACPLCDDRRLELDGGRWGCAGCQGCFVENDALAAMMAEMLGRPWVAPLPAGEPGPRRCPVCDRAMRVETLTEVTIDRCTEHGIWFDPDELATVLARAAT